MYVVGWILWTICSTSWSSTTDIKSPTSGLLRAACFIRDSAAATPKQWCSSGTVVWYSGWSHSGATGGTVVWYYSGSTCETATTAAATPKWLVSQWCSSGTVVWSSGWSHGGATGGTVVWYYSGSTCETATTAAATPKVMSWLGAATAMARMSCALVMN
eukprot:1653270-Pyramimonas_sp.AAC.1